MAQKRLSSLFTLSKSRSTSNLSASSSDSHPQDRDSSQERRGRPQHEKLQKLRVTPDGLNPPSQGRLQDLEPPQFPSGRRASNPPSSHGSRPGSRPGSRFGSPVNNREGSRSRPQTPVSLAPGGVAQSPSRSGTPNATKHNKRRSWLPGSSSKSDRSQVDHDVNEPKAWIAGLKEHIPYDILPLLNGMKVRFIVLHLLL